jgi:hypothetical protein
MLQRKSIVKDVDKKGKIIVLKDSYISQIKDLEKQILDD